MPIERLEKEERKRFTILATDTIEAIQDPFGLAIWTLLLSKPKDWSVNAKYLMAELNMTKGQVSRGCERLRKLGLWKQIKRRKPNGHMNGSTVTVFESSEQVRARCKRPRNKKMEKSVQRYPDNTIGQKHDEPSNVVLLNNEYKLRKNKEIKNNPAKPVNQKLSLEGEFGLKWPDTLSEYAAESRVVSILKSTGVEGTAHARRILGEWQAMAGRGFKNEDALASLVWLAKNCITTSSAEGDELLPDFA